MWEKHAAYWSQHFRCIMPDNRGVGQSDKPPGPYTSEDMADDCARSARRFKHSSGASGGDVSMGSIIAQQLALRHPEKSKCDGADVPLGTLRPTYGSSI